jgi:hypothetical protein
VPTEYSDENVDSDGIAAFLRKPGSIELLLVVSANGATYSEIVEKTKIVDSTVNTRRAQALELNLITGDSETDGGKVNRFYALTPLGMAVCQRIYSMGLGGVFWKLQGLREQYNELSTNLIDWVEADGEVLAERGNQLRGWEDRRELPFDDYLPK